MSNDDRDEKKSTAGGLLGSLKGLVGAASQGASERLMAVAKEIASEQIIASAKQYGDQIALDLEHRRFFLGDTLVTRFVQESAQFTKSLEIEEFVWDGTAYRCRARHDGRTLVGCITVESARWSDGKVQVSGTTPGSVTIEGSAVGTWLLGQFVALFGGTTIGARMFSIATPQGVIWDGQRVTWTHALNLQGTGITGFAARAVELKVGLAHDRTGLWLTVDGEHSNYWALLGVVLGSLRAGASG